MEEEIKKEPEPTKDEEPVSPVEEAKVILDEIKKEKELLKVENNRKEKLQSNELLSSSAGGRQELPQPTEEEKKKDGAKEFFKGTQLEKDIDKL